jgi:hypothetical protein
MDDQASSFPGLPDNFLDLTNQPHVSRDDHVHVIVRKLSQKGSDQLVAAGSHTAGNDENRWLDWS